MSKLAAVRYGKNRVRLLKVFRAGKTHTIKELEVTTLLQGDFESSYTAGDNSKVVPTDTIKNAIHVLAKKHLADQIEEFAQIVGRHFLDRYEQTSIAEVAIAERQWQRLQIDEKPHPHSFQRAAETESVTRVVSSPKSVVVQSGVRALTILKSTESGFEGYPKCDLTTLPETADRILATSFSGTWTYRERPPSYTATNRTILDAMLKVFATRYSPSAQTTLFQMGEAALAACGSISQLDLAMPNKHYLLIDLSPFGLENQNELFLPTNEPHGQIEATIVRDD